VADDGITVNQSRNQKKSKGSESFDPLCRQRSEPPLPTDYVKLGPDLQPIASEDCRNPRFATGSAWHVGRLETSHRNYESAYFCNLFSAGVGSLDFGLGGFYRELRVTIGIADNSGGSQHRVQFEITGDDRGYLDDPVTLRSGQTRDLKVNVMDISRLKLKITELGSPGASDSPSKPFWANPIAVHSHMARATRP
jgi:NPCBM/NEW2 domain